MKIRLPLKKRLDELVRRLSAASLTASPGVVEIPNELFDDMATILEELEVIAFPLAATQRKQREGT